MGILTMTAILLGGGGDSPIRSDEVVVFFPTCGRLDKETWIVPIHGWIFEPELDSPMRRLALDLFRRSLGLEKEEADAVTFKRRARAFLVDNERGKKLSIRLGGRVYPLEESAANGHFHGTVRLTGEEAQKLLQENKDGWVDFQAVTRPDDERVFRGRAQLIGPTGISVISDIDDTIKVSEVLKRRALLANTFLREFQAVPGMADLYRDWAATGATFHYVSASPWQLYEPLSEFFAKENFPPATYHLKAFRWKDSSFFQLFADPEATKNQAIVPLFEAYPRRRFILVGDSGEKDPEIYANLLRKFPAQVARILIRDITGEDAAAPRYQKTFAGLAADRWRIFRNADELARMKKELFD